MTMANTLCNIELPLLHNNTEMAEEKKRVTLFMQPALINQLDYIARHESLAKNKEVSRTDVINDSLSAYVAKWEKTNSIIPKK